MIEVKVKDGGGSGRVACVDNSNGHSGLVVATYPLFVRQYKTLYFVNPTYGIDINQNAAAAGTPDKVHNGLDTVLWTGSQVAGGSEVVFNSAAQNHTPAGSQSIYVNRCEIDDVWQFAKGSTLDLTGYVSLTVWVYIDNNWAAGDSTELYGYDTGTASMIGQAVNLQDYITYNSYDVWQKASIPLADMNLSASSLDALQFRCAAIEGTKPRWYLDDLQFEETGDPITWTIEPPTGWMYQLSTLMIFYADAYAGTLANATMPNIPYDGFFDVPALSSGLIYRRWQNDVIEASAPIKQHGDLMNRAEATVSGCGSDGINSWVSVLIKFPTAVILNSETQDRLELVLTEDLSGLLELHVSSGGQVYRIGD